MSVATSAPLSVLPPHGARIYLASRSPRRRELLRQMGVAFEMLSLREGQGRAADVDETPLSGETPDAYVLRVAVAKAEAGWNRLMQRRLPSKMAELPVLAADTTVCMGTDIFGKPSDRGDAARMLRALSGQDHRVLTAVAVRLGDRMETALSDTMVRFIPLSDEDIAAYVATDEPLDKAGAYAIQGKAAAFVERMAGSYSGVMGLPLHETSVLLARIRQG
jgi:septum formation protein